MHSRTSSYWLIICPFNKAESFLRKLKMRIDFQENNNGLKKSLKTNEDNINRSFAEINDFSLAVTV